VWEPYNLITIYYIFVFLIIITQMLNSSLGIVINKQHFYFHFQQFELSKLIMLDRQLFSQIEMPYCV